MSSFDLSHHFLEFLLKSAGVIALGFSLQFFIRKVSPDTRHSFWVYVFIACLGIPLLLFAFPRWGIIPTLNEGAVVSGNFVEPTYLLQTAEPAFPPVSTTADPVAVPSASASAFQISWIAITAGVWGIGAFVLLIRSVAAGLYLRRIPGRGENVSDEIEAKFQSLKKSLGIRCPVTLLVSPLIDSPFTWGIARTRIALPDTVDSWAPDELEMIFIHELEHIRRRDALAVLISRVFLVLNWMNPFAWIAVRQAVQLREEACDQRVLRSGLSPEGYAGMLFRQAKYSASPFLQTCTTAVAETGTIEKRIKMILNQTPRAARKNFKILSRLCGCVIIGASVVIGISGCSKDEPEADVSPGEKQVSDSQDKANGAETEAVGDGGKGVTFPADGVADIGMKLKTIKIPKIEFADTPLKDALAFLQQRSVELDTTTEVTEEKGFNIIGDLGESENTRITLRLSNVPIAEALKYTTSLAQFKYAVEPHAVVVSPIARPSFEEKGNASVTKTEQRNPSDEAYYTKLESIVIPKVQFVDTPIEDAVSFLQMRSRELDVSEENPDKKGVNIVLAEGEIRNARLNMKLTNVPLSEALRYVAELAGAGLKVEGSAVVIAYGESTARPESLSAKSKSNVEVIEKKLAEITIPFVEFSKTPFKSAIQFLQMRSVELDVAEEDPARKGINVILESGSDGSGEDPGGKTISLKLSNIPLSEAFRYTCDLAGMEYRVEPHNIVISPKK